jgi:hypothetical protein
MKVVPDRQGCGEVWFEVEDKKAREKAFAESVFGTNCGSYST